MSEHQHQNLIDQLAVLSEKLQALEYQQELLMGLIDPDQSPFLYHMLEAKATRQQVGEVYDLMDSVRQTINSGGEPINHGEFEAKIYKIFPERDRDYGFAEGIVGTLNDEHKWEEVYGYYKKHGMNI